MRTGALHVVPTRVVDQPSPRMATQYVVVGQSTARQPEDGEPADRQPTPLNSTMVLARIARQRPAAGQVSEVTIDETECTSLGEVTIEPGRSG